MEEQARRLADYCHDRVGQGLRGVGYHTDEEYTVVYARDDVAEQYTPERLDRFVDVSQRVHDELHRLDEMGGPDASVHSLELGLIIQFHVGDDGVIFVVFDEDIGRNLTRFIRECRERMAPGGDGSGG